MKIDDSMLRGVGRGKNLTNNEAELFKDKLSTLTAAKFQIMQPESNYPAPKQDVRWYVRCSDILDATSVGYVNVVWKDKESNIWLESIPLGNTSDWIGREYGEQGVIEARRIDLRDFANPNIREKFGKQYPVVLKRLRTYEEILTKVSLKLGVGLEMRYDVSPRIVFFRMRARINRNELNSRRRMKEVKLAVRALKEAYKEIRRHEIDRFQATTILRRQLPS